MKSLRWIYYVTKRFSRVENKGRSAVTSIMPALGIGFGVMALIVIMSVMNGFQRGSIDSLIELSSYHIRVTPENQDFDEEDFLRITEPVKNVESVTPFYEAQGLLSGKGGSQSAALIRALPPEVKKYDKGFDRQLRMYLGSFDLEGENNIILGWKLAQSLGVRPGDTINILALSGGSDVDLFSDDRLFLVTGVFTSGYSEINQLFAFIPFETGKRLLGKEADCLYGIKVEDSENEAGLIKLLKNSLKNAKVESWRNFNRTFYGAFLTECDEWFLKDGKKYVFCLHWELTLKMCRRFLFYADF